MLTLGFLLVLLIAYGLCEYRAHVRARDSIPIRVHVNGTRGKSSVTRLIAAGLRAGGVTTFAKVTGTAARYILPDGHEQMVPRRGLPNVIEQLAAFQQAHKIGAQAIVLECMALRPDLQRLTEQKMIASTVAVITNVRADHLEVMGPSLQDVAHAFSQAIPRRQAFLTAEDKGAIRDMLLERARRRRNLALVVDEGEITNQMMIGFPYLEHRVNVALALAVCKHLGVLPDVALQGMHKMIPDPGVLRTYRFTVRSKRVEFINALAANDPYSIVRIWNRMAVQFREHQKKIILLNNRKDRLPRSVSLVRCIGEQLPVDCVVLTGEDQEVVRLVFDRVVGDRLRVVMCGNIPARFVYRRVMEQCAQDSVVFAIGNIGGMGQAIAEYFVRAWAKHA
jgi:poly-gamma-glutamate synthase PgsB/CapB